MEKKKIQKTISIVIIVFMMFSALQTFLPTTNAYVSKLTTQNDSGAKSYSNLVGNVQSGTLSNMNSTGEGQSFNISSNARTSQNDMSLSRGTLEAGMQNSSSIYDNGTINYDPSTVYPSSRDIYNGTASTFNPSDISSSDGSYDNITPSSQMEEIRYSNNSFSQNITYGSDTSGGAFDPESSDVTYQEQNVVTPYCQTVYNVTDASMETINQGVPVGSFSASAFDSVDNNYREIQEQVQPRESLNYSVNYVNVTYSQAGTYEQQSNSAYSWNGVSDNLTEEQLPVAYNNKTKIFTYNTTLLVRYNLTLPIVSVYSGNLVIRWQKAYASINNPNDNFSVYLDASSWSSAIWIGQINTTSQTNQWQTLNVSITSKLNNELLNNNCTWLGIVNNNPLQSTSNNTDQDTQLLVDYIGIQAQNNTLTYSGANTIYNFNSTIFGGSHYNHYNLTLVGKNSGGINSPFTVDFNINGGTGFSNLLGTIDSTSDQMLNYQFNGTVSSVEFRIENSTYALNQDAFYIDQLIIIGYNNSFSNNKLDIVYKTEIPQNINLTRMSFNFTGYVDPTSYYQYQISAYNFVSNEWQTFQLNYGDTAACQYTSSNFYNWISSKQYPTSDTSHFWSFWFGNNTVSYKDFINGTTNEVWIRFLSLGNYSYSNAYTLTQGGSGTDAQRLFRIYYYTMEPRYYLNVTYTTSISEAKDKISQFTLNDTVSGNETLGVYLFNWDTNAWDSITTSMTSINQYSDTISSHQTTLTSTLSFDKYINGTNNEVLIQYSCMDYVNSTHLIVDSININTIYEASRNYSYFYDYSYYEPVSNQDFLNFSVNMVGSCGQNGITDVRIWNYDTGSWETMFTVSGTAPFDQTNSSFTYNYLDYVNSSGYVNISVYLLQNDAVYTSVPKIDVTSLGISYNYINTALNDLSIEYTLQIDNQNGLIPTANLTNLQWSVYLQTNITTSNISAQIYNFQTSSWVNFTENNLNFTPYQSGVFNNSISSNSTIRHYLNTNLQSKIKIFMMGYSNPFQISFEYVNTTLNYYPLNIYPSIPDIFMSNITKQVDNKYIVNLGQSINFSAHWDESIMQANLTQAEPSENITLITQSRAERLAIGDFHWTNFTYTPNKAGNFTYVIEVTDNDTNGGTHSSTWGLNFVVDNLQYVSESNNLTAQITHSGLAEVGQNINFSATFNEPITNAWFQYQILGGFFVNSSLSPTIIGDQVTFVYNCKYTTTNNASRILVFNNYNYKSTPAQNLTIIQSYPPKVVNSLTYQLNTGSIILQWNASTDNVAVTHYNIYRSINATLTSQNLNENFYAMTDSNVLNFTDSNITQQDTYYYTVVAFDGAGNPSVIGNIVSVVPDLTPPMLIGTANFFVNGVSSKGIVTIGQEIIIHITASDDCKSVKLYIVNQNLIYPAVQMTKLSNSNVWQYTLNTSDFYLGQPIAIGTYNLKFVMTDFHGNTNNENAPGYTLTNALTVVNPHTSYMIYLIIGAVAVAGVVVTVVIVKKKGSSRTTKNIPAISEKARKRQIYSGASQIGKRSGAAAEALMSMRQKKSTPGTTSERLKTIARKPRITPNIKVEGNLENLPEAVQTKLAERQVEVSKRMKFLDSKLDSLDSQIKILTTIISTVKDDIYCPICGHTMGQDWEFCPYCKIKDQEDELNMKKSFLLMESKRSVCPKCGLVLDPSWPTCPRCFSKEKTQNQ